MVRVGSSPTSRVTIVQAQTWRSRMRTARRRMRARRAVGTQTAWRSSKPSAFHRCSPVVEACTLRMHEVVVPRGSEVCACGMELRFLTLGGAVDGECQSMQQVTQVAQ